MGKQEQMKVTKENLLQWIKNYHWMVATIEEARKPVAKVDNNSYIGAKYGKRFNVRRSCFDELRHNFYFS
ncbi:hypothetical protein [Lysinibacillus sp. JNUCC-52]|uniref:hypothetical protein n=1 Tax=Lysinibacillus sp. JNUCC-52 TaxID=2792480 RepID=UPI001936E5BF|nr:hypothetical protein JNUCC52_00840 [Lysinibacillus sp. JNUCC-52]